MSRHHRSRSGSHRVRRSAPMRAALATVGSWLHGTQPPLWVRLGEAGVLILLSVDLAFKRGPVVGAMAAVVYGAMALSVIFAWDHMVAWPRRHPHLDNLLFFPLAFLALALITNLVAYLCALIALGLGLVLDVVPRLRRGKPSADARPSLSVPIPSETNMVNRGRNSSEFSRERR